MLLFLTALVFGLDAETEEALKAFAKDYGAPAAVVRAAAVSDLAKLRNPATRARLGALLVVDEESIRIAAAEGLGEFTEERDKAASLLINAVAPNAKLFRAESAILVALGKLGDESALPSIHQAFDSRDPKDTDFTVAKAALKAAGMLRSRDSIDPLIDLAKRFEKLLKGGGAKNGGKSGGAGLGIAGGTPDPQTLRAKALNPAIFKALQSISKEKWVSLVEWEIWWEKHKATFKP
ncbi:MAG TPA: hypothetical protein VKW04_19360 [Planctomycetota bacterium]|nr:hypothetical protein [Planctomycetota bacterium]